MRFRTKKPIQKKDIVRLIEEIKQLGYLDNVIFISFSFENCTNLRELMPNAVIQWLYSEQVTEKVVNSLIEYRLDLDIHYKSLTAEAVELLHSKGIKVNCWTCDSVEDAELLAEMNIDYLTSNILE